MVALFVALGGSSYAALTLPKNGVGSKQIKNNAVTSKKVKPGSLLTSDFKASQRASLRGHRDSKVRKGFREGLQGAAGTARAYGEVVINGGNFELVPGSSKGVVAIAQGGGGNPAASIQLDSSIPAATAITVATSNNRNAGGQAFDTQVQIARPPPTAAESSRTSPRSSQPMSIAPARPRSAPLSSPSCELREHGSRRRGVWAPRKRETHVTTR